MAAEKFIADFHALPGTTLGEIKKSFNHLLNANATLDTPTLNIITQNLQPMTYMERLLKLDFLIFYKRSEELLQLFKDSSGATLTKILKQDWFFLERFPTLSSVQDVLLDLGFNTRMKFLNRLSRLAPFFDEVFDFILTRYGVSVARKFILGCSSVKLREVITNYKIHLTSKELESFYKKDRSLIEFYFDVYIRKFKINPSSREYGRLLRTIAEDDLELYLALIEKSYFKNQPPGLYQLGSRLTAKVARNFRATGKEQHTECLKNRVYLRKSSVANRKKALTKLYLELKNNNLNPVIRLLQKAFPQKYRYEILLEVVGELRRDWIEPDVLELVPSVPERARLANLKLGGIEDELYIKYLEINEALSNYEELINVSSQIYRRAELLEAMVEACSISKSLPALKSVMDYFLLRHKNDDEIIHSSFTLKVEQHFSLQEFDENLWAKYQEIVNISQIKYMITPSTEVYLTFIEYKYKNKCDISELVQKYWKDYPNVVHISACGEAMDAFINTSLAMNDSTVDRQIMLWLLFKQGPKKLYDYPRLVDLFKSMVDQHRMLPHLKTLVFDMKFEDRINYIDVYFRLYADYQGINWFLTQNPGNLSLERLFHWTTKSALAGNKSKSKTDWRTWHLVKQYHELCSSALVQCKNSIPNAQAGRETVKMILAFSLLASFEQYVEVLNSIPTTSDRPLSDEPSEELRRVYALRCEFGRRLMNFELTHELVKTLFDFCKGDYFQSALPSLLSIAYRFPEKHLEAGIVRQLKTRSVTVRKHALFLSLQLRDQASAREELLRFVADEKDISIQKRIYLSATIFLWRNPCDEVFAALLESLKRIRKEDVETLNLGIKIDRVPEQYHTTFFQAVWAHLIGILTDSPEKLKRLQRSLLSNVTNKPNVIAALPFDFISNVTGTFFLSDKQVEKEIVYKFLSKAVVNGHEKILDEIFWLIKTSNDHGFFESSYPKMMWDSPNPGVAEKYIQGWHQFFNHVDNFKEFSKLEFLKFKSKHLETSVEEFCKAYLEFFDETFEKFGSFILWPLVQVTRDILGYFTTPQVKVFHYMESLLKARPGDSRVAMTVIQITSEMTYQLLNQDDKELLVRLVDLLKLNEDPAVKVNCTLYLQICRRI